jgi:hypothetical protein
MARKGSGNWKPLKVTPPGVIKSEVPAVQPILPPGAQVRPKDRPKPVNRVKPVTGLEKPPKGKGGSKSAN